MRVPAREYTHWVAGYRLPHAALKLLARRGNPLAQLLTIGTNPGNDIYPLIEQVRARGSMSAVGTVGWVSTDAQIVREVLRGGRFRTIKQWDRSPVRVVQWILAKTVPDVSNPLVPPAMLVTDPLEHTRLRRVVSRAFTPRALDELRTRVHEIAEELLRGLEGRADCDLAAEYASQIPIAVIAEMLAIPRYETGRLIAIAESSTRSIGTTAASWHDFQEATKDMREFDEYLGQHIERLRQDNDSSSILSDVIHNGDLTEVEIRTLARLLLGAGFITTAHTLGKAVVALVRHREQLAILRANPAGWPNAIEEILR